MLAPQPEGLTRRVREAREAKGYSTRGAARHLKCTAAYLGQLERGERSVSFAWAAKFAALYGVTMDWLTFGRKE